MRFAEIAQELALIVPLLLLFEGVIALVVWVAAGGRGGRAAQITAWLGLTTLTLWCGSGIAFAAIHILLFTLGTGAALIGIVITTLFMLAMPFGWALIIHRRGMNGVGG